MNNERLDKYQENPKRRTSAFQPLYYAGILIVGIVFGSLLGDRSLLIIKGGSEPNPNKLVSLIDLIENYYVDSVDKGDLINDATAAILSNLDPHSYYMSPDEYSRTEEELSGGFYGIGIEFLILRDSLMVVKTVDGGPSQEAGVRAGDRIVAVDGLAISGKELSSEKAQKLLKGPSGSKVHVALRRPTISTPVEVDIVRGSIPIQSVPVFYQVEEGVGYIRVERFAKTTYDEFRHAADQLTGQGCSKLILDFRGNGGGFLDQATYMVEEFLTPGKVIVYTEGVNDGKEIISSGKDGMYKDVGLVVLIDQGSASASEIVAGALQDWDPQHYRWKKIFREGIGSEKEIRLPDKSALRLTVARYYTPTGRCIQKPYGDNIDYSDDFHQRFVRGELMSADSVRLPDSLKKVTPGGRIVYGGGGIMPDVFVPLDSVIFSGALAELNYSGAIREYTFDYVDSHRRQLSAFKSDDDFIRTFEVTTKMIEDLIALAGKGEKGIPKTSVKKVEKELKGRIKAQIARTLYSETAMYKVSAQRDHEFEKALEIARDYQRYAALPSVEPEQ